MENSISQTLITTILLVTSFFTTTESFHTDATIATTLSSSGFTLFAHALHAYNLTTNTPLTFLAPPDTALINTPLDINTVRDHITNAGAYLYDSLLALSPNTTIPTLRNNTALVVNTDGERVSFNDVLVAVPNLYVDGSCVVHGIDAPLLPISISSSSSSIQDFVKSRKRFLKETRSYKDYVRFIRRSNRPSFINQTMKSDFP